MVAVARAAAFFASPHGAPMRGSVLLVAAVALLACTTQARCARARRPRSSGRAPSNALAVTRTCRRMQRLGPKRAPASRRRCRRRPLARSTAASRALAPLPPCSAACNCRGRSDPVCTTTGLVYSSACAAACARQTVRWPCRGHSDCLHDCTAAAACRTNCDQRLISPVCTKKGVVYANSCLAVRTGATMAGWLGV